MNNSVSAMSNSGRAIALHRQQLKQRVEAQELDAGVPEYLRARHAAECLIHDALGVRIAVVAGIAQQNAAAAEQGEINAPGIDAQTIDAAVSGRAQPQRLEQRIVESENVPMQAIQRADGAVGEAVDYLQFQLRTIENADDAAAALGAEIESQELLGGGHDEAPYSSV